MGLMPVWFLPGPPWLGRARAGAARASQLRVERVKGMVSVEEDSEEEEARRKTKAEEETVGAGSHRFISPLTAANSRTSEPHVQPCCKCSMTYDREGKD